MDNWAQIAAQINGEVVEILDGVGFEIWNRILYNQTNSGNPVNSLLLPADTTGKTAESIRVESQLSSGMLNVSLIGRKGIMNIDKGNPPAESSGEWSNFDSFYYAIKEWARAKERRYGLEPNEINAYSVASHVWLYGSVLWRAGGGTETIRELLPPAAEKIEQVITNTIDKTVTERLVTLVSYQE